MGRASPMQVAFNAGEWHSALDGRVDQERYGAACRRLRNFWPLVEGPAERRAGTRHVAMAKTTTHRRALLPFRFSTEQAYVLELGENWMRFYTQSGQLLDPGTGLPLELVTPWTAAQARQLQVRQSADVLFMAHPAVPPQKLSRTGASSFTLADYAPDWAPFRAENTNESLKIQASAITGVITLTATGFTFADSDQGRLVRLREIPESKQPLWAAGVNIHNLDTGTSSAVNDRVHWEGNVYRLTSLGVSSTSGTRPPIHTNTDGVVESDGRWSWEYIHSGSGYAIITSVAAGGATATATVLHRLPDSVVAASTFRWAWGAWDETSGYPRALEFFEERLWWGGTDADPDLLWATRPGGAYDNFRPDRTEEGALSFRLLAGEAVTIETMAATRILTVATSAGIFPAAGRDPALAVSIENELARDRQVNYGARAGVQALAVDNVSLFVQRSGRALREVLFSDVEQTYQAPDLTVLASHLVRGGIRRVAYAQEPYRLLLAACEDGALAAALYDRAQEALAFCRVELGGSGVYIEDVCTIPHPDGDSDQVWLAVERTFLGTVTRSVEFLEKGSFFEPPLEDSFYVDGGLTYEGPPATVISGIPHEGETVAILADGARVADRLVSGGKVTLDEPASVVHVGLPYSSLLVPMRPEPGDEGGAASGKTKRWSHVVVRLHHTGEGLYYGSATAGAELDELVLRDRFDLLSTAVPLIDETADSVPLPWPDGHGQDGFLAFEHRGPTPCTIVALMGELVTGAK
jgi:hypothetical protein